MTTKLIVDEKFFLLNYSFYFINVWNISEDAQTVLPFMA